MNNHAQWEKAENQICILSFTQQHLLQTSNSSKSNLKSSFNSISLDFLLKWRSAFDAKLWLHGGDVLGQTKMRNLMRARLHCEQQVLRCVQSDSCCLFLSLALSQKMESAASIKRAMKTDLLMVNSNNSESQASACFGRGEARVGIESSFS